MGDTERSFFNPEYSHDKPLHQIIETENNIIDARSDAFYAANLFDIDALVAKGIYDVSQPDWSKNSQFDELDRQFRAEHEACTTMSERLMLFLDERYLPYLSSLDLDKTRNALDHTKLDNMVEGYREMGQVAIRMGLTNAELPREKSGRTIHFRPPASIIEDKYGLLGSREWSVGVRNRPLLRFKVKADDEKYRITIPKRMTFAIPTPLMLELTEGGAMRGSTRTIHDQNSMEYLENMLDEHDSQIVPIRTLYYVTNNKVEKYESLSFLEL